MKQVTGIITIVLTLWTLDCKPQINKINAPVSDLGHIDLILDSIDYYSIINNSFLTGDFGLYFKDTVMYGGKPSYDIYLAGLENFLHISLAKGYWVDKAGSGVMAFQSRRPDMKDSLLVAWKQHYADSLINHVFEGKDFQLGEIMTYRPKDDPAYNKPVFFSNLTSYSRQSLKNWGMNDSLIASGISMQHFMKDWDPSIKDKLFKRITQLNVQVTKNEFKDLQSALKTVGYTQTGNTFNHKANPKVYFDIVTEDKLPKYKRIEIELSRPVQDRDFAIGNSYNVTVSGTKMILLAK